MINFKDHIILDKIDSWPKKVLELIKTNEELLIRFLNEEHRIEKLGRIDLSVRFNPPKNIYREKWENIIFEIEEGLKEHLIVGFHCTKLLNSEIEDIQINGLRPLSKEFAKSRIESAYRQQFISEKLKNKLETKEELEEDNRVGKIFVFHCLSTLKDELGLNRLLGYWGGESIYAYINNNQELLKIGTPCIVVASIKIIELEIYTELSKRMIAIYLNNDFFPHDTDSIIESNLSVLRIIKREEKIFEDLTEIENWKQELD